LNRSRSLAAPRRPPLDASAPAPVYWGFFGLALALLLLAGLYTLTAPGKALEPLERALAVDPSPRTEP